MTSNWKSKLLFLFGVGLIANCLWAEKPIIQTPAQIEAAITEIWQIPKGDEFIISNPFWARQRRLMRLLPPESIPILIRRIQSAKTLEEEIRYEILLRQKVTNYGVKVPEPLRQIGLDFLLARYEQTQNSNLKKFLLDEFRFIDDPKIEHLIERLTTSQNPEDRKAAENFRIKRDLTALRELSIPQTRAEVEESLNSSVRPDTAPKGKRYKPLPPEAIPLLAQILRQTNDENERWRCVVLLTNMLDRYQDEIPTSDRQSAIDALINECERSKGNDLRMRIKKLKMFEDAKIDQYAQRLATSQDAEERAMGKFLNPSLRN